MKRLIFLIMMTIMNPYLFGQNVGIGTTSPNASAKLDVTSTTQGMLVPRMTSAQRTTIASPVQGLLVFDITTNSFWFRNTSSWVELVDSDSTLVHRNGPAKIYMGLTSNVGVGTINPSAKLDVNGNASVNGFLGIGTTTPHAGLQFSNTPQNRKVVLFESANNDHQFAGFGNNSDGSIRYQTAITSDDHIFYAGTSTTASTELMRISGTGKVGIGIPNPLNKLDISSGNGRTGVHPTGLPMYVTGALGPESNGIEFRHENSTQGIGIGYNTIYAVGTNSSQELGLSAKGATGNLVFKTNGAERARIDPNGNVGVGTTTPHAQLQFSNAVQNRKVVLYEAADNNNEFFGFGINADGSMRYQTPVTSNDHVFYVGTSSTTSAELMRIKGNGNVGFGINPNAPLQLSNTVQSRKLVLFDVNNNDHQFYGFGVNDGALRYQTDAPSADHVFYAGTSSNTSNELMRIKGNGKVGIGVATPTNQVDIHTGVARTGTHPSNLPLYVTGEIGADTMGMEVRYSNGAQGIGIGYNTIYAAGSDANQNITIAAKGEGGRIRFNTNDTERMQIGSSGNVNIYGKLNIGCHIAESTQVNVPALTSVTMYCGCQAGEVVLGGGYWSNYSNGCEVGQNRPYDSSTWTVTYYNADLIAHVAKTFAICARLGD